MGNMWGGSNPGAVQRFKTRRDTSFAEFENRSNPVNLIGDPRIVNGNQTVDQIEETFNEILNSDLSALKSGLHSDKYNAYTVLCAFVWRAIKINREINCITEMINEAFDIADEMDEQNRQTGYKGPLFGLPFSVKSNFYIKDYDVTVGLRKNLEQPKQTTCPMVEFLKNKGGIPFCLTNVPQGLLSYVTSNPLYGTTKNPWDFSRTPGGSSGGEAALLAAGGSAFGIGSDLAGSLRIPAAFCGLTTLKPTQDRLHVTDTHGGLPGRGRLGLSFGFYTRTVDEQDFLLRLIVGNEDYLELCPMSSATQLKDVNDSDRKPVIGWFEDDGFNPVVPSNRRAVKETIEKLRNKGYEVVEFKMSEVSEDFDSFAIANMLFRNVMPDNGAYVAQMYENEPFDKYMSTFIRLVRWKQGFIVRNLLRFLAMPLVKLLFSKRLASIGSARNSDLAACRENQENTDKFKLQWIRYWKSKKIDALICPSFITPAQPFKYPAELSSGVFITGLFNMLDVPAGVVPVSPVNDADMTLLYDPVIGFSLEGDLLLKKQRDAAKLSSGLPNSVQVNSEKLNVSIQEQFVSLLEMDLLVFDAKRNRNGSKVPVALNKEELSEMLGHRQINAFMIGGLVQIFDETISQILNECSGIGEWMDDGRKENHGVSRTCFSRKEEIDTENKKEIEEAEAAKWAELSPTINSLVLSPMETVLLSIDWKLMNVKKGENLLSDSEIWMKSKDSFDNPDKFGRSFAVFRYLKMNGWIVRSGMTFGCDFLIYCLGAQYYHSSAGVLISENIHPQHLLTLTRILAHNKKSLIVATASKDVETFEDLSNVEVKHVTMKTYFLERDVSQISHQRNELYELKPID